MERSKLILVGGFLGAGKTSLLWHVSRLLDSRGIRAGMVTNDQAAGLVDTAYLQGQHHPVREVSGSCFCCNFNGFAGAIEEIHRQIPGGVILAEPVGSCTDLSATLMQPLKEKYAAAFDLAPLTVLADPERLRWILDGADTAAAYIGAKQFEEADLILINKIDLLNEAQREELLARTAAKWPQAQVMLASVKEGTGIDRWLERVMQPNTAGSHLAQVDYDRYAAGEAAYGWLNVCYDLDSTADLSQAAGALLQGLETAFAGQNASVGHVKFLLQERKRRWIGNLTGGAGAASLREEPGDSEQTPSLTVNARVEMGPDSLEALVQQTVAETLSGIPFRVTECRCLIPGRPNPTYRYHSIAGA